ncbi:biotin--[acetyl-CoA-carboxylase] ligase [Chachezhania sediminis]|uniref:biotin--[acetyl-CoA-carboxylase] ligase n=1 Tax=Chachezhania sediminis TaxID=2599291 RepID=UPI00131E62C6|nr:biotin--[acetyl-CoA-carboxylase] ligase [Chachezhania sediminis]
MSTEDWPTGYDRRVLHEVDSTLSEAARVAATLDRPTWILAHRQTAARGRRGRAWSTPVGNFAATLILTPSEPAGDVALRSFVTALALYDAVAEVVGSDTGLRLKWPNDVLLNGGKLAGILLESSGLGTKVTHLFIGIGVNLASAPQPSEVEARALRPVSLLGEAGVDIGAEAFLDALAQSYARQEARFVAEGFAPIRAAWLARAAKLGEVITARTGKDEIIGRFDTVDEQGNLVLSTLGGRRAIPAAEVFF